MGDESEAWSVSTSDGATLGSEDLLSILMAHHERLVTVWRGFTPQQWQCASRNSAWSVHQTVRHVADAMERGAATASGDNDLRSLHEFDARSTPNTWLEDSIDESPMGTVQRFDDAACRFRDAVRTRLSSADDSRATTVYGEAHWTMNVVHLLWDSWIHERDVLLPLDLQQHSSGDEERLVGLYGVFMAAVPSKLFDQTMSTTVELVGRDRWTLSLTCDAEQVVCTENPGAAAVATGEHGPVVDALAGRGLPLDVALPGAPEQMGMLAAYFNS